MSCPNSNHLYGPPNSPLDPGISVSYNNQEICPTPVINYTHQPVEFGYIYGYNTDITLDGIITGITSPELARTYLTSIFSGQFKTLVVDAIETDGASNEVYNWQNVIVENISLEQSQYLQGSFIKYKVKCTAYAIPDGVIDPSNEFSFTENDDGTINVTQKISARGVSIQKNGDAFEKAKLFVQGLTGQKPTYCGTIFLPTNDGVLLSVSENANRPEGIYSVTKTYKYNTNNAASNYVRYTSIDINDSIGIEYKTADYTLKIVGSPIEGNLEALYSDLRNFNVKQSIQDEFGFNTLDWVQNNYSANVDDGLKIIDIKAGYLVGANLQGFFDYIISYDKDEILGIETWKVDGEFKCFGPLSYKNAQLNNFKTINKGSDGWKTYLTSIIQNSPLYTNFHNFNKLHSPNCEVNESETKEMALLRLSMTLNMGHEPTGTTELKYEINGSPSRWIYEILPSANVEGNYIVQDLQTKTNTVIMTSVSAKSSNKENALSQINNYLNKISEVYVEGGTVSNVKNFITEDSLGTSTYDVSVSKKYLGETIIDDTLTQLIAVGSLGSSSVRPAGFNFGY